MLRWKVKLRIYIYILPAARLKSTCMYLVKKIQAQELVHLYSYDKTFFPFGFTDPRANKCFIAFITHTIFISHYSTSTRFRMPLDMCICIKSLKDAIHVTFDSFHSFFSLFRSRTHVLESTTEKKENPLAWVILERIA